MQTYLRPGVYKEDVFEKPAAGFLTGVPAFLGFVANGTEAPQKLALWPQFEETFGAPPANGFLAPAVRGFFENEGTLCYVVPLRDSSDRALDAALATAASLDDVDLVCAPDLTQDPTRALDRQQKLLDHCERMSDRFAILDALPKIGPDQIVAEQRTRLSGINGALYHPWIKIQRGDSTVGEELRLVPPCGHVAGVYARGDEEEGSHKAPANEALNGVLDLGFTLSETQLGALNEEGVNCIRSIVGQGIRVWGARTLAGEQDREWKYISGRRTFLSVGRWIDRNLPGVAFEPNDLRLWARITRELTTYLGDLLSRGALAGATAEESFYVKCDAETNPPQIRDRGSVVTEIGLALAVPNEFVKVRVIHGTSGVSVVSQGEAERSSPIKTFGPRAERPTHTMRIVAVESDPESTDALGEYVVIENPRDDPADMTGWMLRDHAPVKPNVFTFPPFVLTPRSVVRVLTGGGTDTATDLYWKRGTAVWNNVGGDTAFLRDADGVLIDEFTVEAV